MFHTPPFNGKHLENDVWQPVRALIFRGKRFSTTETWAFLATTHYVVLALLSNQPADPGLQELDGVVLAAVWGPYRDSG